MKRITIILTVAVLLSSLLSAEDYKIRRFGIDFKVTFMSQSKVSNNISVGGLDVNTGINGISGKFALNYYYNDRYTFFVSAGMLSAETETTTSFFNTGVETNVVSPIYFGAKYYLIPFSEDAAFKPYVNGGFGVAIGVQSSSKVLNVNSSVESAPAAFLGGGVDLLLSDLIKLTFDAGYNLISDFSEPIGTKKNYSGAEIAFGLGLIF